MAAGLFNSALFSQEFKERSKSYEKEEKKAMSGDDDYSYKVELYVYDMTKGLAKQMSPALLGKQIEGIWHTGIVAYGREYYFGSGGIESCPPGGTILGEPTRIEDLGDSQVPYQLFLEYIFGLGESGYSPGAYDLLKHNCNNFSEEVSEFLCGRGIPKSILTLPDEVLNTDLGEILAPLAKALQLKSTSSRTISLAGAHSVIQSYVPRDIERDKKDPEYELLNSAIEEARHKSQQLESRRNNLNEKLLKKEKKERKKAKKEKKKKKKDPNQPDVSVEVVDGPRRPRKRGDSVHFATEPEILTNGVTAHRRLSVPVGFSLENIHPTSLPKSILRNHSPTATPISCEQLPTPQTIRLSLSELNLNSQSITTNHSRVMEDEIAETQTVDAAVSSTEQEQPTRRLSDEDILAEPEVPREPPILFKDDVNTIADFDGFVQYAADLLTPEEQKHMEELRAYVVEDEGSWSLGEDFNKLFQRIFFDSSIPVEAQRHLVRIMAGAALKDDVILMLHQDRKEHTIMNFANKIESFPPEIQEALALFFCNMFEHVSPSEWLLYISEWAEGSQQISNIRVTTKVAVNALLHSNPKVMEYGTALMYNLGTKEVKTVVFDDVAPELAMAILQFLGTNPTEEYLWRTMLALSRFCYSSSEVLQLIQMIGPDPKTFRGKSERLDEVIEEINTKMSRIRSI